VQRGLLQVVPVGVRADDELHVERRRGRAGAGDDLVVVIVADRQQHPDPQPGRVGPLRADQTAVDPARRRRLGRQPVEVALHGPFAHRQPSRQLGRPQ
jgi:hypothetical protein